MTRLDEIKLTALQWFVKVQSESTALLQKAMNNADISLAEVDNLIDTLGKYQAFIICLRGELSRV